LNFKRYPTKVTINVDEILKTDSDNQLGIKNCKNLLRILSPNIKFQNIYPYTIGLISLWEKFDTLLIFEYEDMLFN
jgi:hypothetical protein